MMTNILDSQEILTCSKLFRGFLLAEGGEDWDEAYFELSEPGPGHQRSTWIARTGRTVANPQTDKDKMFRVCRACEDELVRLFDRLEAEDRRPKAIVFTVTREGGHRAFWDYDSPIALNISPFHIGLPGSFFLKHDEVDIDEAELEYRQEQQAENDENVRAGASYMKECTNETGLPWDEVFVRYVELGEDAYKLARARLVDRKLLSYDLPADIEKVFCDRFDLLMNYLFDTAENMSRSRPRVGTLRVSKDGTYKYDFDYDDPEALSIASEQIGSDKSLFESGEIDIPN